MSPVRPRKGIGDHYPARGFPGSLLTTLCKVERLVEKHSVFFSNSRTEDFIETVGLEFKSLLKEPSKLTGLF